MNTECHRLEFRVYAVWTKAVTVDRLKAELQTVAGICRDRVELRHAPVAFELMALSTRGYADNFGPGHI